MKHRPLVNEEGIFYTPIIVPPTFYKDMSRIFLGIVWNRITGPISQLHNGDKSLVGNKGHRRYLKVEESGHFVIEEKQVQVFKLSKKGQTLFAYSLART